MFIKLDETKLNARNTSITRTRKKKFQNRKTHEMISQGNRICLLCYIEIVLLMLCCCVFFCILLQISTILFNNARCPIWAFVTIFFLCFLFLSICPRERFRWLWLFFIIEPMICHPAPAKLRYILEFDDMTTRTNDTQSEPFFFMHSIRWWISCSIWRIKILKFCSFFLFRFKQILNSN